GRLTEPRGCMKPGMVHCRFPVSITATGSLAPVVMHGSISLRTNTSCNARCSCPIPSASAVLRSISAKVSPTLRDPNTVVLEDVSVDGFYWYHSSRYENWPDLDAYTAEITDLFAQARAHYGLDPDELIHRTTSLAVHLGTYESAIENMLRRLIDQDSGDLSTIR